MSPSRAAGDLTELAVQVLPFADTQPVQELVATHLAETAPAQLLPLLAQVLPQLQVGQEVGVLHS